MRKMMLKMMFAGAAALALLMGGCMLFDEPGSEVEFDEFGRPVVTLSIFTGDEAPRNMSLDMAQALINYFEVVFYNGNGATVSTNYRSVSGPRGKVLTIRLNPQSIDTAAQAVVFGGYWNKKTDERTLLAVGKVTAVNEITYANDTNVTTVGPFAVTTNTKAIVFTMQAITTTFANKAGASLQLTGANYGTYGNLVNRVFDFEDNGGMIYPFFTLPSPPAAPTAIPTYTTTLTFGGLAAPNNVTTGIWVNPLPQTTEAPTGGVIDVWSLLMEGDTSVILMRAVATTPNFATAGVFPTTGQIGITLQPTRRPQNKGWVMMVPNFDVRAINSAYEDGDAWMLSNGITFYEPHDNQSAEVISETAPGSGEYNITGTNPGSSMGGGILFCIGDPTSLVSTGRAIKIIVVGPNT